jgi:hypothetical protein
MKINVFRSKVVIKLLKKVALSYFLLTLFTPVTAQLQESWKQQIGTEFYNETLLGMDIDSSGNVYVVGTFKSMGTDGLFVGYNKFGQEVKLISTGGTNYDVYVVKYNPDGVVLDWSIFMGLNNIVSETVKVSPGGNVYLLGYFDGTLDIRGRSIPSYGETDVFLIKLQKESLWDIDTILTWGSVGADKGIDMDIDTEGNVYVTGTIQGNTSGDVNIEASGKQKIFVTKMNKNNIALWTNKIGSELGDAVAFSIHVRNFVHISYMSLQMELPEFGMYGYNVYTAYYAKDDGDYYHGHGILSDLVSWGYEGSDVIETDSNVIITYFRNTVYGKTNHVLRIGDELDNAYRSDSGNCRINCFSLFKNKIYQGGTLEGSVIYENNGEESEIYNGEKTGYFAIFDEYDMTLSNFKFIDNSHEVTQIQSFGNFIYVGGIIQNPNNPDRTDVFLHKYIDITGLSSNAFLDTVIVEGADSSKQHVNVFVAYLPHETKTVPKDIDIVPSHPGATYNVEYAERLTYLGIDSVPDYTEIQVISENQQDTMYFKVAYLVRRATNAELHTLSVPVSDSLLFDDSTSHFTAYLPYWIDSIPAINVFLHDEKAKYRMSSIENLSDTMTISVIAHDTTVQKHYTIDFVVDDIPVSQIKDIAFYFAYDSLVPGFSKDVYVYDLFIPADDGVSSYLGALDYTLSDPRLGHALELDSHSISLKLWVNDVISDTTLYKFNVQILEEEEETSILIRKNAKIEVYPNPFTNRINIVAEGKKYNLVSSAGQVLAAEQNTNYIETSHLAPGIYYIVFDNRVFKVVKE